MKTWECRADGWPPVTVEAEDRGRAKSAYKRATGCPLGHAFIYTHAVRQDDDQKEKGDG